MRLLVHDFSGHPFQVELSRALAGQGHSVEHQYCPSFATGHGALARNRDDPEAFRIRPMPMVGAFKRYSAFRRVIQELAYGVSLGRTWKAARPDAIIMCNIPLIANYVAVALVKRSGASLIFWHQDVYSHAIGSAARSRLGWRIGGIVARAADRAERRISKSSDAVVVIAENFLAVHRRWGVSLDRVSVIPNWAPLKELPQVDRDNAWARQHGLVGHPTVIYSGTLGLKHNPRVLLELARNLERNVPEARVVIISEGQGRDWLEQAGHVVKNLTLLDYQPYDVLPEVLGTADLLVTILEADAGQYSVPSKVLSYLCSGRAILGIMPSDNAAADILEGSGAGVVLAPDDFDGTAERATALLGDAAIRAEMGRVGRMYAEGNFVIEGISKRFNDVLVQALAACDSVNIAGSFEK